MSPGFDETKNKLNMCHRHNIHLGFDAFAAKARQLNFVDILIILDEVLAEPFAAKSENISGESIATSLRNLRIGKRSTL